MPLPSLPIYNATPSSLHIEQPRSVLFWRHLQYLFYFLVARPDRRLPLSASPFTTPADPFLGFETVSEDAFEVAALLGGFLDCSVGVSVLMPTLSPLPLLDLLLIDLLLVSAGLSSVPSSWISPAAIFLFFGFPAFVDCPSTPTFPAEVLSGVSFAFSSALISPATAPVFF
jgi:hypothetical protein